MQIKLNAESAQRMIELDIEVAFKPGDHKREHRRLAVGQLLAELEATQAQVVEHGDGLRVTVEAEVFMLR
ncbi:MAG: hypothetical protein AAF513_10250 [Pseudomonadota bacterium]